MRPNIIKAPTICKLRLIITFALIRKCYTSYYLADFLDNHCVPSAISEVGGRVVKNNGKIKITY